MTRKCTLVLHIAARGLCDVKGKRCTSVLYNQCKCTLAQSKQCTVYTYTVYTYTVYTYTVYTYTV